MFFPWLVSDTKSIKLIVGLGNPGLSYKKTRHNAGARAVEKLGRKNKLFFKSNRSFKSLIACGKIQGQNVCLALPQTFMNRSGEAVAALVKKKNVFLEDLLVVSDDVALSLGDLKAKAKGSDGGHKGLACVIERLGTENFPRLRLGIGSCFKGENLTDHVLSLFEKSQESLVDKVLDKAVDAMEIWLSEGIVLCMDRYNGARPDL